MFFSEQVEQLIFIESQTFPQDIINLRLYQPSIEYQDGIPDTGFARLVDLH